jgi:hypothetical protein
MKLTSNQINSIAQELEVGMKVFVNKKTLEYRSILDYEDMTDTELWNEEIEKIEREWTDYIVIEKMDSYNASKIMEGFLDEINDINFKEDLARILNRKSPFANFKIVIESSKYRKIWFEYRTKRYEEYVKDHLDIAEIDHE